MSFTDTLTLDNASGTEATFALIARDSTGTVRRNTATTNAEPELLSVRHSVSGKGADAVDRHLFQVVRTELDAGGKARQATVNLTISHPRATVITDAEVFNMVAYIVDHLTDGGFSGSGMAGTTALTQLLRGES